MQNKKIKNNLIWIVLIIFVILFSVFSIIRIIKIKPLYLYSNVRQDAIQANIVLKKQYGIGATDLKLKRIESEKGNKNIFYFDYNYHHPAIKTEKKKIFKIIFNNNKLINITEL